MRGFFCGSLNPCTCQAAPALNVWLVQHLMLRRNYLHSSICHNHGIFCTISVTMVFTYLQLAAWKHKLQAKGSFDSRTKNTKQALGFWAWNWSCASWDCESHHHDIHIYTVRLSGSASSFHTPKSLLLIISSGYGFCRVLSVPKLQVYLVRTCAQSVPATKRNDGLPWPPLSDPATHPFPNQVTPWQSSDKSGSPPRACVANPRCLKGLIGPASNCSRTFRKLNCWRSVPFKETHRLHGCVAHQRNWSAHPDKSKITLVRLINACGDTRRPSSLIIVFLLRMRYQYYPVRVRGQQSNYRSIFCWLAFHNLLDLFPPPHVSEEKSRSIGSPFVSIGTTGCLQHLSNIWTPCLLDIPHTFCTSQTNHL